MERTGKLPLIVATALAGMLIGGLLIEPAGAHLGGFKHLKKHFYAKAVAQNLFLSPGETASNTAKLGGLPASSYITKGPVQVTISPGDWIAINNKSVAAEQENGYVRWHGGDLCDPAPDCQDFANLVLRLPVQAPVTLHGRPMELRSAELCYDATEGGGVMIDIVLLSVRRQTVSPVAISVESASFPGPFLDETCRVFQPDAPIPLTEEDTVELHVELDTALDKGVSLGRTTFTFEPV